jgi:hypothetical protein
LIQVVGRPDVRGVRDDEVPTMSSRTPGEDRTGAQLRLFLQADRKTGKEPVGILSRPEAISAPRGWFRRRVPCSRP